jgi:hypothetical protein
MSDFLRNALMVYMGLYFVIFFFGDYSLPVTAFSGLYVELCPPGTPCSGKQDITQYVSGLHSLPVEYKFIYCFQQKGGHLNRILNLRCEAPRFILENYSIARK